MKKYYITVSLSVLIIIFVLIGKNVIPTKVDIEYLQVVEIIGMDKVEDGVNVSVLLKEESNGDEQNESQSGKVLTVTSTTYSQAIDIIRAVTEKYVIINHVKYYIVGEETAKDGLESVVDFLARTDDTNVKAQVLVAENMSAKDFLNSTNNSGMDVVKTLQEASLDINAKNFTTETTIIDLVNTFLKDDSVGVIPYVSFFGESIEQFNIEQSKAEEKGKEEDKEQSNNESKNQFFGYMTVGIIQDMEIIDKITLKEVEAYNIVMGNVDNLVVLIRPTEKEKIVLTCDTSFQKIKFKTKGNEIKTISIVLKYECDLDEVESMEKLFTIERFNKFEQMVEQVIQKEVENIIQKSFNSNLDFMDLGKTFEIQHPYVYRNIKEEFLQKLKEATVNIEVECTINNTFDVMETNKYQKGDEPK